MGLEIKYCPKFQILVGLTTKMKPWMQAGLHRGFDKRFFWNI